MIKKIIRKILKHPFLFLNKRVKQTNWYKNIEIDKSNYPTNEWYRDHTERNFDIINLGSSSALYAFDYSDTGLKAFNWGLQPQSMEYSFKVLKNFYSILKHRGFVVIPFSPFSALSVKNKWNFALNDRYYGILDYTLIENHEEVASRRNYPLRAFPKVAIKRLIKDIPPIQHGRAAINKCVTFEDFTLDAKRWIELWKKEFSIDDLNAPISDENLAGMRERRETIMSMIEFCIERELQPILVITPMHPILSKEFSPEFRNSYIYSYIKELNIHNIPFLDYMDSVEFTDDQFYQNSFFLSEEGAKKFTNRFLKDLGLLL